MNNSKPTQLASPNASMENRPFWLTKDWWSYILAPVSNSINSDSWYWTTKIYLRAIACRWRGHPHSVIFYNPNGLEPDMTCTNCGDDLG